MTSLLNILTNPIFYKRLPIPVATITSIGLLSYYINVNKEKFLLEEGITYSSPQTFIISGA